LLRAFAIDSSAASTSLSDDVSAALSLFAVVPVSCSVSLSAANCTDYSLFEPMEILQKLLKFEVRVTLNPNPSPFEQVLELPVPLNSFLSKW
jgi:hypothetical protein